jgi:hypothetical protein
MSEPGQVRVSDIHVPAERSRVSSGTARTTRMLPHVATPGRAMHVCLAERLLKDRGGGHALAIPGTLARALFADTSARTPGGRRLLRRFQVRVKSTVRGFSSIVPGRQRRVHRTGRCDRWPLVLSRHPSRSRPDRLAKALNTAAPAQGTSPRFRQAYLASRRTAASPGFQQGFTHSMV